MDNYPEIPLEVEIDFAASSDVFSFIGKTLIFYDQHHGSAVKLVDARCTDIVRLFDGNTVVIVLD